MSLFHLKIFKDIFISVLLACMHLYRLADLRRSHVILETGIMETSEPPCWCWEQILGCPQGQQR